MPRWLSEGISVYEERQRDRSWGQAMTPEYRAVILGGKMPPVSKLSGAFLAPESPMALQFAYFESSLVVEFLIERHGIESLKQMLADLGAGVAIERCAGAECGAAQSAGCGVREVCAGARRAACAEGVVGRGRCARGGGVGRGREWMEEHPDNFEGLVRLCWALEREQKWQEAAAAGETTAGVVSRLRRVKAMRMRRWLGQHRELGDAAAEREALEAWAERASDVPDVYDRLAELAADAGDWQAVAVNARRGWRSTR